MLSLIARRTRSVTGFNEKLGTARIGLCPEGNGNRATNRGQVEVVKNHKGHDPDGDAVDVLSAATSRLSDGGKPGISPRERSGRKLRSSVRIKVMEPSRNKIEKESSSAAATMPAAARQNPLHHKRQAAVEDEVAGHPTKVQKVDIGLLAPGWTRGSFGYMNQKRRSWISPTRKIEFKYSKDAHLFESLRKKFGSDEVEAWLEYTKIKHSLKQAREVINATHYDEGFDVCLVRKKNKDETILLQGGTLKHSIETKKDVLAGSLQLVR